MKAEGTYRKGRGILLKSSGEDGTKGPNIEPLRRAFKTMREEEKSRLTV